MLDTGLVSVTFRKLKPDEIIRLVQKAGLHRIEWGGDIHVPAGDYRNAELVGKMTREAGLAVGCYGSYFRMDEEEDLDQLVNTAKALGAPLIRVWAGKKGSASATPDERNTIAGNTRRLADLALQANIGIVFEYHGNTLTDTADSALQLMRDIGRSNTGCQWQPPVGSTTEQCLSSIDRIAPYLRNVHTFSWTEDQSAVRLSLSERSEKWKKIIDRIAQLPGDHSFMLEFVKNDDPDEFLRDAGVLKEWLRFIR